MYKKLLKKDINSGKLLCLLIIFMAACLLVRGIINTQEDVQVYSDWLGRFLTLGELTTLALFVYRNFFEDCSKTEPKYKRSKNQLWLAGFFAAFCFLSVVTSYITVQAYSGRILSMLFLLTFLLTDSDTLRKRLIVIVEYTLFFICLCSLIVALFGQGLVFDYTYGILYPAITARLTGLTSHANTLGYVAAATVIIGFQKHKKLWVAVAGIALFFSQSKTMYLALFAVLFLMLHRYCFSKGEKIKKLWIAALIVGGIAALGLSVIILPKIDLTFTGRTYTWAYGLTSWSESARTMILGCGNNLYTEELAYVQDVPESLFAFLLHAHNQFVHTLTCNGIITFIPFLAFIGLFVKSAWQQRTSNYTCLLLTVMFLMRMLSETPFLTFSYSDLGLVMMLLFLHVAPPVASQQDAISANNS